MLFLRNDVEATILRLPGQIFQTTENTVKNVYTFKLINKTNKNIEDIEIKLISHSGKVEMIGGLSKVEKQGLKEGTLFIEIAKKDLNSSNEKLKVGVYSKGKLIEETTTNFAGPLKID